MCRFTFHETDMLASDLARLLQSQNTDSLSRDSTASAAASTLTGQFPGIILLYDDRPCAAIGYTREPCETIAVFEPVVLLDATTDVYRALCGLLIRQVKRLAIPEGFQRVRLLIQASAGDARLDQVLTEHGFVPATDIVRWDRSVAVSGQCPLQNRGTFELYDFTANPAAAREIPLAIDEILECSEDLTSQPQPSAAELLTSWQRIQANVFVYRIEQNIAGIMSCVTNPNKSAVTAAPSATLPSKADVGIEYIGVVPAFRRRHVASLMIGQIPELLSSVCDAPDECCLRIETEHGPVAHHAGKSEPADDGSGPDRFSRILAQALRITAYSDAANTPANCLYQSCGFIETTRHHLWCCDLAKTNHDACG